MSNYKRPIIDLLEFLLKLGLTSPWDVGFKHNDHNRWHARHTIILNKRSPL